MAGRENDIKKQNNAVKSAQIRSVFIFFFFFFHQMRQTFFLFLFQCPLGSGFGEEESGYVRSGEGGGERSRLTGGAVGCFEGFGSWCLDVGFSTPLGSCWPSFLRSSFPPQRPRSGPLTQAGDVGPAAWWRHDALGVPARNVVVNLSAG